MRHDLKRLIGKLNDTTRATLEGAAGLCLSRTHYDVDMEHWFLKLLDSEKSDVACIVDHFKLSKPRSQVELNRRLDSLKSGNTRNPALGWHLVKLIQEAWIVASIDFDANAIRSGHVLLAALADESLAQISKEVSPELTRIDPETLKAKFFEIIYASEETSEKSTSDHPVQPPKAPEVVKNRLGPTIFICYRREDSASWAEFLNDRLSLSVKGINVFRDADTLKGGMVYPEEIEKAVANCDALLAVIGKKWLNAVDSQGKRRLDNEGDWVRVEIGAALRQKKVVIPCLVGGAKMPNVAELPPDLESLTFRQGVDSAVSARLRRTRRSLERNSGRKPQE